MKKYNVAFRVYMDVEVEAESLDDAIEKANEKWYYAEFGDNDGFKVVDGESFYAETDDGTTQRWFY